MYLKIHIQLELTTVAYSGTPLYSLDTVMGFDKVQIFADKLKNYASYTV